MAGNRQRRDEGAIISAEPATIDRLRAYLSQWPELWNVDDCNVGDQSSGQYLASKVVLAVVLPTVDPSASILGRGKL